MRHELLKLVALTGKVTQYLCGLFGSIMDPQGVQG
jgi:hypothetical protein